MKTIYLQAENGWKKFEYENISELQSELNHRNILIDDGSVVNDSYIGDGSMVLNGSTVNGSTVLDGSTVLNGSTVLDGSRVMNGSTVLNGSTVNGSRVNGSRVLDRSTVNGSTVLNGSTVNGSTVNGSRVDGSRVDRSRVDRSRVNGSTVLNGSITKYTAIFILNGYKYSACGYFNKENQQTIQLGCYTRSRLEWENDFWNNTSEFPNDGSDSSEARMRTFKLICNFFDMLKK